jgi:hypothetical protein
VSQALAILIICNHICFHYVTPTFATHSDGCRNEHPDNRRNEQRRNEHPEMAVLVETNNDEKAEHRNEKVPHNYHDYANEVDDKIAERAEKQHFMDNFPIKLHYMLSELETDGMDDVVSWQPHGRSFIVHKQPQFVEKLLPL